MGMIGSFFQMLFGGERNVIKETAEVFRPNAENQAQRDYSYNQASLAQFAAEFAHERKGWFDRFVDALNRLPRPLMALGAIALIVSAMWSPVWFAARMQGVALIPEPLWWLIGLVAGFYFGGRHQAKSQDFQKSIASMMNTAPAVIQNIATLEGMRSDTPGAADTGTDVESEVDAVSAGENAALRDWRDRG